MPPLFLLNKKENPDSHFFNLIISSLLSPSFSLFLRLSLSFCLSLSFFLFLYLSLRNANNFDPTIFSSPLHAKIPRVQQNGSGEMIRVSREMRRIGRSHLRPTDTRSSADAWVGMRATQHIHAPSAAGISAPRYMNISDVCIQHTYSALLLFDDALLGRRLWTPSLDANLDADLEADVEPRHAQRTAKYNDDIRESMQLDAIQSAGVAEGETRRWKIFYCKSVSSKGNITMIRISDFDLVAYLETRADATCHADTSKRKHKRPSLSTITVYTIDQLSQYTQSI